MDQFFLGTLEIIFGGAVLGLLTFVAALLWNLRKEWILDHVWQKEAQKTLFEYGEKFKQIMLKFEGIDSRLTDIEHPSFYRGGKQNKGIKHDH